jgi:hypothetical protein
VFASAAAVGAGLAVNVDHAMHRAKIGGAAAGAAVAIPVAIFLTCLWVLHERPHHRRARPLVFLAVALILLTPFAGYPVLATGLIVASLVASKGLVLPR